MSFTSQQLKCIHYAILCSWGTENEKIMIRFANTQVSLDLTQKKNENVSLASCVALIKRQENEKSD